ncbi:uncharacterized protein LOC132211035 [Stegostoma tigrinum]|uniref:uncharacterized protein LOC132211035 n=1 Tax=Stegostoma tigrinum TaxID=3053191 RepID=UPI0028705692|nr:uncharacterized protein LOC132211035 [Stegostoma tigrinum]
MDRNNVIHRLNTSSTQLYWTPKIVSTTNSLAPGTLKRIPAPPKSRASPCPSPTKHPPPLTMRTWPETPPMTTHLPPLGTPLLGPQMRLLRQSPPPLPVVTPHTTLTAAAAAHPVPPTADGTQPMADADGTPPTADDLIAPPTTSTAGNPRVDSHTEPC